MLRPIFSAFKRVQTKYFRSIGTFYKYPIRQITDIDDYRYIIEIKKKEMKLSTEGGIKNNQFLEACKIVHTRGYSQKHIDKINSTFSEMNTQDRVLALSTICLSLASVKKRLECLDQFLSNEYITLPEMTFLFTFPAVSCYYIHTDQVLPIEYIAKFENAVFDKGILMNLRELRDIVDSYKYYKDKVSKSFYNYVERCILHNLDNELLSNQYQFKLTILSLVKNHYNLMSTQCYEKILNVVSKYINKNDYTMVELKETLIELTNRTRTQSRDRYVDTNFGRQYLSLKFIENIKDYLFSFVSQDRTIDPQLFEVLLEVSSRYSEVLIKDGKYLANILMNNTLSSGYVSITTVASIIKVMTFAKSILLQQYRRKIEAIIISHMKDISNTTELRIFVNYSLKTRVNPVIYQYLELKAIEFILNIKNLPNSNFRDILIIILLFKKNSNALTISQSFMTLADTFIDSMKDTLTTAGVIEGEDRKVGLLSDVDGIGEEEDPQPELDERIDNENESEIEINNIKKEDIGLL